MPTSNKRWDTRVLSTRRGNYYLFGRCKQASGHPLPYQRDIKDENLGCRDPLTSDSKRATRTTDPSTMLVGKFRECFPG